MITVKILCACGTKFAFDADPNLELAAGVIQCPSCGAEAATTANEQLLAARQADSPEAPHKAAPIRVSVAQPAHATTPANSKPEGAMSEEAERPVRPDFSRGRPLTKAELQIRRNRETDRRRQPYILAAILMLAIAAGFWGWYSLIGAKPKVVLNEQYERPLRPVLARLLADRSLLLIRNREVTLHAAPGGKVLWEKSLGSVTNFEDNLPIHVETSTRVDRPVPELRVMPDSVWLVWPDQVVQLDKADGTSRLAIKLRAADREVLLGERLLLVGKPATATNQLAFEVFPLAGGAKAGLEVALVPIASLPDLVPDGDSVVAVQSRIIEEKIIRRKLNTGPKVMTAAGIEKSVDQKVDKILDDNLTAAGSLRAATRVVSEWSRRDATEAPDELVEDHSRYEVELRRVHGVSSSWKGEVTGPPRYFPLPTVDVVVGEKDFKVIDKSGKLKWEATLSYPLGSEAGYASHFARPDFSHRRNAERFDDEHGLRYRFPFVERGDRLYAYDRGVLAAFDLATGEVKWRVTSVGIRKIMFDQSGQLYACTTLDSPERLNRPTADRQDAPTDALLKIETQSGKVLWQGAHLGTDVFISGKFVYSQWVGENLLDNAASMSSGADPVPSCAFKRINPATGEPMWRLEYKGDPTCVSVRDNWLLIQFPRRLEVAKFFSL